MGIRSRAEYEKSLKDGRVVYYDGRRVEDVTSHPAMGAAVGHAALDFELSENPRYSDLCVELIDGKRASRLFRIPQSAEHLHARSRLVELLTREGATLVTLTKEIGTDAIFGLLATVSDMGDGGVTYDARVRAFWRQAMDYDLAMAVAQTDVKGDRSQGPSGQSDPDLYVRVVDRNADGIVVRGAKAHTSIAVNANEIVVLPTRALNEDERDYAVAFAVPANTPGLKMIASPFASPRGAVEERPISATRKMVESLTIFEDVFVPWERVFLCGEWRWAGPLALRFVEFHRFTAISYKLPLCDALTGVAVLSADQNGIRGAGHVREKLTELVRWTETLRALVAAAADRCERCPGGLVKPNTLITNIAKYHFAHGYHEAIRHVQDLAGGLVATAPSWKDIQNPETVGLLHKYLKGAPGAGAEERLRTMNLVTDLTAAEYGGYQAVLAVHAEGSLEAEKLQIYREAPLDNYAAYARRLAGLSHDVGAGH